MNVVERGMPVEGEACAKWLKMRCDVGHVGDGKRYGPDDDEVGWHVVIRLQDNTVDGAEKRVYRSGLVLTREDLAGGKERLWGLVETFMKSGPRKLAYELGLGPYKSGEVERRCEMRDGGEVEVVGDDGLVGRAVGALRAEKEDAYVGALRAAMKRIEECREALRLAECELDELVKGGVEGVWRERVRVGCGKNGLYTGSWSVG